MESNDSWYVGSAWNKTTAHMRYVRHLAGKGGAGKLWTSISDGVVFTQVVLESGSGQHISDAYCAEERWIATLLGNDARECLNVNLYPSRRRGWAESPESIARRAAAARGRPNVANSQRLIGQPRPDLVEAWNRPGERAKRSAAVSTGMANMTAENKTKMHNNQVLAAKKRYAVKSTACRNGHQRTLDNTYVVPKTGRIHCRICTSLRKGATGRLDKSVCT